MYGSIYIACILVREIAIKIKRMQLGQKLVTYRQHARTLTSKGLLWHCLCLINSQ